MEAEQLLQEVKLDKRVQVLRQKKLIEDLMRRDRQLLQQRNKIRMEQLRKEKRE